MPSKCKAGVIHGRFQPVHHGHMEWLMAGKKRCDFLYVGVTMPDPRSILEAGDSPQALQEISPFTYFERLLMLRKALAAAGVPQKEFAVVPFPLDRPEFLKYYVPMDAVFFMPIYGEQGERETELFLSMGLQVDVMWRKSMSERFATSTQVRDLIAENGRWDHLVPSVVYDFIIENGLDVRITGAMT